MSITSCLGAWSRRLGLIQNEDASMDMDLLKSFIAGQLRHVLTGWAGYLVAKGVLIASRGEAFTDAASAIALYGIGVAWSWFQKWRSSGKAVSPRVARLLPLLAILPLDRSAEQRRAADRLLCQGQRTARDILAKAASQGQPSAPIRPPRMRGRSSNALVG